MRVYEQIYTSAPRLLEGGGNLGVVAETRDFPRSLAPSLAPLRAYTMLPRYDVATPAAHPPRLVIGPIGDGRWFGVTRVVFAGADHTGRTTPLTHHVLTDVADAKRQTAVAAEWVAGVFPLLRAAWTEPPQWVDPPRSCAVALIATPSPAWRSVLPWLAGTLFDFPHTGRAIVVVIDPETAADAPAGLLAAFALLPPSVQWTTTLATHVVGVGDFVREAGLLVTYPDSSFLDQCRLRRDSRAPLIVDLSKGPTTPTFSPNQWGEFVCGDVSADFAHARGVARQFDALHLTAADAAVFAGAAKLVDDLAAAPAEATGEDWKRLAARAGAVRTHSLLAEWVATSATAALRTLAANPSSASRWSTLAAVTANPRWPEATRAQAAALLLDGGDDALDAAAEIAFAPDTASVFRPAVAERPGLARATLAAAAATADPAATRRAAFVLSAATLAPDEGRRAVAAWSTATPAVRQQLQASLVHALAGIQSPADIVSLGQAHPESLRPIVLPLLLHAMRHTHDGSWSTVEAAYRDTAVAAGLRPDDYTTLFQEFGPSMTRGVDGWLRHPAVSERQRLDIRAAAERSGVIAGPKPLLTSSREIGATPQADVDRPRPRRVGSAGPIRTAFVLAVIAGIGGGVSVVWAYVSRENPLTRTDTVLLSTAAVCVGVWLATELFLRLFIRSPQQLIVARLGRWAAVLLLTMATVAGAWPAGTRAWQIGRPRHVPTTTETAPAGADS